MAKLPVVTDAVEMLYFLGFDATCRLVMFVDPMEELDDLPEDGEYVEECYYAICEHGFDYDFSNGKLRQIAVIPKDSEAAAMLTRAYDFDVDGKGEEQPIKYGPWCSHWALPEYHAAIEEREAQHEAYLASPEIERDQKHYDIVDIVADMIERWLADGVPPEEFRDRLRQLFPEPERELPAAFYSTLKSELRAQRK